MALVQGQPWNDREYGLELKMMPAAPRAGEPVRAPHRVRAARCDGPEGGPDLTFDALLPKPGRYRIWTQFQRGGEVSTASFTVEAAAAPAGR